MVFHQKIAHLIVCPQSGKISGDIETDSVQNSLLQ